MSEVLVAEPKGTDVAVFSYGGVGLAIRIQNNTIDEVFDIAKKSIKKKLEEESESEEGKEIRSTEA